VVIWPKWFCRNVVIILTHKTKLLLRPGGGGLCFTFYDRKNAIKMFKVGQIGAKQRQSALVECVSSSWAPHFLVFQLIFVFPFFI